VKIMHIITGLGIGGAETMLLRFLSTEESRQHDVNVVSLRTLGSYGEEIQRLGIPVLPLDMRTSGLDPMAVMRLRRHVQRVKPDIIQTWMYHSDLAGGLIGKSLGIPVVWGIHNELLHPDEPSPTVGIARQVCSRTSSYVPDAIVSCSESAARYHVGWGYDPSKIHVIPNGFDLAILSHSPDSRRDVREELGIPQGADIILHVARMNPVKNHQGFIEAADLLHKRRPDVHFVMAGYGVERDNAVFQPWLADKNLDANLHMIGAHPSVRRYQDAADVATLTSYSEAFPMVIGESMALGTPFVTTDVGDAAFMVGDTGIVVPVGDSAAMADAWDALLAEDAPTRQARSAAARKHIEDHFSISLVASKYLKLYDDVLSHRKTMPVSPPVSIGTRPRIRPLENAAQSTAASWRQPRQTGALVISLDFELLWGMQDVLPIDGGDYWNNLLGSRTVIPRMLELFAEYGIAVTWATVGMLFASNREELETYFPDHIPAYMDPSLSTRGYPFGENETDDPLHYAPTLIDRILQYPRQEIGTHTFSHYYCLEPGQTEQDFLADMQAAVSIAADHGVSIRSMVFPRNQHNPDYDQILLDAGLTAFRGNRSFWPDQPVDQTRYFHPARRVGRLVDIYLPIAKQNSTAWSEVLEDDGLGNVPAHRLMLPRQNRLESVRIQRVINEMKDAARSGRIYHIWWHPHNFGIHQAENLRTLRAVFDAFAECRDEFGMRSLTMAETVEVARTQTLARPATRIAPHGTTLPIAAERRVSS